jgi:hypothetical protein
MTHHGTSRLATRTISIGHIVGMTTQTSITADTYGHVMDSAKAHALGVVDDMLSG